MNFLNVPTNASVVDPSCGSGSFIRAFSNVGIKNIVGCDFDIKTGDDRVDNCYMPIDIKIDVKANEECKVSITCGLSKIKNFEYSEYDDPTSFGIYTSEDISKMQLFGLKYVGSKEKLEINDYRKFDINKGNFIALMIIFLLGIVGLIL
jgi:hypothetical protein